jgi:adenine-specific DNA methylase
MKRYTDKQIRQKFEEIITECYNWYCYSSYNNSIRLDGGFSSDELREIARTMDEIYKVNKLTELNKP